MVTFTLSNNNYYDIIAYFAHALSHSSILPHVACRRMMATKVYFHAQSTNLNLIKHLQSTTKITPLLDFGCSRLHPQRTQKWSVISTIKAPTEDSHRQEKGEKTARTKQRRSNRFLLSINGEITHRQKMRTHIYS